MSAITPYRFKWPLLLIIAAIGGYLSWVFLAEHKPQYQGRPEILGEISPDEGAAQTEAHSRLLQLDYKPKFDFDSSGFYLVGAMVPRWTGHESLEEVAEIWETAVQQADQSYRQQFSNERLPLSQRIEAGMTLAILMNYNADPYGASKLLAKIRSLAERDRNAATEWLASIIYLQGVTGLRCGENDNCVMCRGDGACILPIRGAAVHQNRVGSELAIKHFTEYLQIFPEDKGARWLLNLAHMTLGEYPEKVDSKYLLNLPFSTENQSDLKEFRDIAFEVNANRFNQAGGAIMDDLDNDGFLDITTTSFDLATPMSMLRNTGDGKFVERTAEAGVLDQLGGLYCVQADFNNDGFVDIFIPRGAWLLSPLRPTLLENKGDGTFQDVTESSQLLAPANSNSATWGDFDNDGLLDLFVCCERQPNRLYKNLGDGTFDDVAKKLGVAGDAKQYSKGATWIDYNQDSYLDLFVNHYSKPAQLFMNREGAAFQDISHQVGIDGPKSGFSCWAWDYDQDGWQDIFATSYELKLSDAVATMIGDKHSLQSGRLFRNIEGVAFQDQSAAAGLDGVYGTMGSNFGDIDADGYPDIYLATGEPKLETLIPNRLLRNVAGDKFENVTSATRTGHLQKGHAVSFADWDRDGDADFFVETGGAGNGDRFFNVLFENPGNTNAWVNIQLIGTDCNRSAIGSRIEIQTTGKDSRKTYKHVTTGSSFGANPLEQFIGLGDAETIASLAITWAGTGKTEVYSNARINSAIQIIEGRSDFNLRDYERVEVESDNIRTMP